VGAGKTVDDLGLNDRAVDDARRAVDKLRQSFSELENSLDPFAAAMNEVNAANDNLTESQQKGFITLEKRDELFRVAVNNIVGFGNAEFELARKIELVNAAREAGFGTDAKAIRLKRELVEETNSEVNNLVRSVSLLAAANFERQNQTDILDEAAERGVKLAISREEIDKRLIRTAVGAGNAAAIYADKVVMLNKAFADTAINQEEFIKLSRDARIEMLETQRTFEAGAERAFLKFVDDATDAGAQTERLFNDVFNGLTDVIENFVKTGELSFKDLAATISATLIEIGAQQAAAGLFGGGGFGFGGPSFGGSAGGGLGGLLGGFGSFLGDLLPFQRGGSFTVGSNNAVATVPGVDNRVVAFRARDGENVSVTPKSQSVSGMGGATIVNFNVSTPDANSFNRSRSQTSDRAARAVQRATSRRR
jgi:hypothetical protein